MPRQEQARSGRSARGAVQPAFIEHEAEETRVLVLGGSGVLAGPGVLTMATRVQLPVRVERLYVVGIHVELGVLDPASYRVTDLRVGTQSQLRSLGPLPGTMFAADATGHGRRVSFDPAFPGMAVSVSVSGPAVSLFQWGALASVADETMERWHDGTFRKRV